MKPTLRSTPFQQQHHHHHRDVTPGGGIHSLWLYSHAERSDRMSHRPASKPSSKASSSSSPPEQPPPVAQHPYHHPQPPLPQQHHQQSAGADNGLQQLISSLHQNPHHFFNFHHPATHQNNNQYLLDDFGGDEFDVSSLSSLCLGGNTSGDAAASSSSSSAAPVMTKTSETPVTSAAPAATSTLSQTSAGTSDADAAGRNQHQDHNNNISATLINPTFFALPGGSDGIKVEDEYLLQFNMSGSMSEHQPPPPPQQQHQPTHHHAHHHQNSSPTSEPVKSGSLVQLHLRGPSTPQQQSHPTSAPSPAMLLNHLDLSSIRSPSGAGGNSGKSPTSTSATPIHHHHGNHQTGGGGGSATTTHLRAAPAGFDSNELYYGDGNADDSCQSLASVDSSTIVHNTKSLVLIPPSSSSSTPDEKLLNQVSKRIRFKGVIEQKPADPEQQQQPATAGSLESNNQAAAAAPEQLDLNAAILEQNPFAYRPPSEALVNENIYSSRNVANCYSYAWRRWSKTDAPSVKNRAGTVQVPHTMPRIDEDGRKFQYILGAPTSAGTRVGLMTMTYLNQGQSYEIRLKKLKKVAQEPNLKTSVKLGFVEKRLQYRENEELSNWIVSHNNGRMIDIDFSMSYGVFDVVLGSTYNHSITFIWNPGREASIFVKINCISTEFTSKRHGGERGTPFRLIVDTYSPDGAKLDSACCLVKVFKSKGAERKHKTDRDRVAKHPDADSYYQPSYDCTLLTTYKESDDDRHQHHQHDLDHRDESSQTNRSTESPSESEASIPATPISPGQLQLADLADHRALQQQDGNFSHAPSLPPQQQPPIPALKSEPINAMAAALGCESTATLGPPPAHHDELRSTLPFNSGAIETYEWLKRNRFFRLAEQLCDYTADDLRRLSRDDLIQLCDFKDGIRLYNLIHSPLVASTKLTIFITLDGNEHYALYFQHLTVEEFRLRISETLGNMDHHHGEVPVRVRNAHMAGPNGIRVKLTDNVIQNMKNESIYNCMLSQVEDQCDIVIQLSKECC